VIWPGDLDATFARAGEPATDDGDAYTSVGGLPASVIAGLSLSASGFPFYGADTGGYRHAPPDAELLMRWIQQTALSTVMQVGNGASTVPWEGELEVDGVAAVDVLRTYARLHLRLFPYLWSEAQRMPAEGRPIQRPLGLAHPELGAHPDDAYLLGPDLLVAPVLTRGARAREVPIPPGAWIDWWTGERVVGPGVVVRSAAIDELPLFLREGAVVPLLRSTIDAIEPTREPERVDAFATRPGPLWLRASSAAAASGELWDGTTSSVSTGVASLDLAVSTGTTFAEAVVVELVAFGAAAPAAVTLDGSPLAAIDAEDLEREEAPPGWSFDARMGGTLNVRLPAGSHQVRVQR
jgi:alpha-D-xyloside xylohydrolase